MVNYFKNLKLFKKRWFSKKAKLNKDLKVQFTKKEIDKIIRAKNKQLKATLGPKLYKKYINAVKSEMGILRNHFDKHGWPLAYDILKDNALEKAFGEGLQDYMFYKMLQGGYKFESSEGTGLRIKKSKD